MAEICFVNLFKKLFLDEIIHLIPVGLQPGSNLLQQTGENYFAEKNFENY